MLWLKKIPIASNGTRHLRPPFCLLFRSLACQKSLGTSKLSTNQTKVPLATPTTMVANVQSLVPKLDELLAVLEVYPAEFVCLTETWLNESCPDSLVHLPRYL